MPEKRITMIRTLDGFESEPFVSYVKTPEEEEADRHRLYPTQDIACYLQYPCSYCERKFYRMNPIRGKNMFP
jgi:hypothetical protein